MQSKPSGRFETEFENDVYEGLSRYPKRLYSRYIYDETGDKLFQQIMAMPTYYLTDLELRILQEQKSAIAEQFKALGEPFELYELGAGDGKKTKILLKELIEQQLPFTYRPIDISSHVLEVLEKAVLNDIPGVDMASIQGTYFNTLRQIKTQSERPKVILFLGSNIGNLLHPQAVEFLSELKDCMGPNDLLFIGFDQKKNPQTVLDAYNDKEGITAAFNKNLLHRINKELGGNFDPDAFTHWESYDPETGTARSFLVSKSAQEVRIEGLELDINFKAWETIHTEISQKYDAPTIEWLCDQAGLETVCFFSDSRQWYCNYLLKAK